MTLHYPPPSPSSYSAVGEKLYLYGGVDKEDTYVCATGLYVFSTGTHAVSTQSTSSFHHPPSPTPLLQLPGRGSILRHLAPPLELRV